MRTRIWSSAALALAATLTLVGLVAPAAQAATFTAGLTATPGMSDDWGNQNGMSATQVTTGATGGTLSTVALYVGQVSAAPNNHAQVAVYADANNLPGAKLAASGSQVLTANAWNSFALSGPAVAASTRYWLVFNVDGSTTRYKISGGGRAAWKIPTTFGTWPATFGAPNPAANSERYAINMTWTNVATPPTTTTAAAPTTTTAAPPPTSSSAPPPPGPQACPPLPAHPTPDCTGVPAGTVPADTSGDITVTQDGTVIDGKHISGSVVVKARNVVIRNSVIDNQVTDDFDNTDYSFTISDTTVGPAAGCLNSPGVYSQNFTATRVEVRGHDTGFQQAQPGDYATVRDSFAKVCGLPPNLRPPDGSHADPFQAYCPQTACGMTTLDHNTFQVDTDYYTAAVFAGDSVSNGHPTGLSLTGNLLIGGVYSIYVGWQGGPDYTIADNAVVANSPGFRTWDYGASTSNGSCAHQVWSGNQIVTIDPNYVTTSVAGSLGCAE
jgi:hypothetical protein